MSEEIGIVCTSCKHFNRVFTYDGPIVLLDIEKAGEGKALPVACESCSAALTGKLEPARERAEVADETARVKREATERAWGR
jgi:hypothetical protein